MINQLEKFSTWLTDMDWQWWPVLHWRPPKNRLMNQFLVMKLTATFGSVLGLGTFLIFYLPLWSLSWELVLAGSMVYGWIFFSLLFESTVFFWNRRARRLQKVKKKGSKK